MALESDEEPFTSLATCSLHVPCVVYGWFTQGVKLARTASGQQRRTWLACSAGGDKKHCTGDTEEYLFEHCNHILSLTLTLQHIMVCLRIIKYWTGGLWFMCVKVGFKGCAYHRKKTNQNIHIKNKLTTLTRDIVEKQNTKLRYPCFALINKAQVFFLAEFEGSIGFKSLLGGLAVKLHYSSHWAPLSCLHSSLIFLSPFPFLYSIMTGLFIFGWSD